MNRALHYYMVKEHYSGMQVVQRGVTYYLTRSSGVRGTAAYEIYTYSKWHVSNLTIEQQNPKISYRLFSVDWKPWVEVPHNAT